MECIEKLVNEIYNNCKIPFQLIINDVGEFSTPQFKLVQNNLEKYFNKSIVTPSVVFALIQHLVLL